jgi:hypothetical protein
MQRGMAIVSVLLMACAGCGEAPRAKTVPLTPAQGEKPASEAVTKVPRAIATH